MKLATMTSKSGKTKYFGVEFDNGSQIKAQSRTKAKDILRFLTPDSTLELVKKPKHHCYRLLIDGQDCGRISKKDYKQLKGIIENGKSIKHSDSQTTPSIQCTVDREEIREKDQLLHIRQVQQYSDRDSDSQERCGESLVQSIQRVETSADFFDRLTILDRKLTSQEHSECPVTSRLASIRRGQLEIAFEQREIAVEQQEIEFAQREIEFEQRAIELGQRAIELGQREISIGINDYQEKQRRAIEYIENCFN